MFYKEVLFHYLQFLFSLPDCIYLLAAIKFFLLILSAIFFVFKGQPLFLGKKGCVVLIVYSKKVGKEH